jgi:hypothetical protein
MSLFPAYFGARKRADEDSAPAIEPENESRADIFNLIPPRALDKYQQPKISEKSDPSEKIESPRQAEGRDVHAVNAMDLTRLSIDNDGRLYWDGKPVEVRRRLMMSQNQVIGAGFIAFFIIVAAIASVIQATATLSDWACRTGSSQCNTSALSAPTAPAPRPRVDIPL